MQRADLPPGMMGLTDWRTQTVYLDNGLTPGEARAVFGHERQHASRAPVFGTRADVEREELVVEMIAARTMIPATELAAAFADAVDLMADRLGVDAQMLETRLAALTTEERAALYRYAGHLIAADEVA